MTVEVPRPYATGEVRPRREDRKFGGDGLPRDDDHTVGGFRVWGRQETLRGRQEEKTQNLDESERVDKIPEVTLDGRRTVQTLLGDA